MCLSISGWERRAEMSITCDAPSATGLNHSKYEPARYLPMVCAEYMTAMIEKNLRGKLFYYTPGGRCSKWAYNAVLWQRTPAAMDVHLESWWRGRTTTSQGARRKEEMHTPPSATASPVSSCECSNETTKTYICQKWYIVPIQKEANTH